PIKSNSHPAAIFEANRLPGDPTVLRRPHNTNPQRSIKFGPLLANHERAGHADIHETRPHHRVSCPVLDLNIRPRVRRVVPGCGSALDGQRHGANVLDFGKELHPGRSRTMLYHRTLRADLRHFLWQTAPSTLKP